MTSYGVTMQQVFTALGRGNANAGGSYVEQGEQQYIIRGIGLLRSLDDIGQIVVAQRNGVPVLIRDIAAVAVGAVPRQGIVGQDGDDEVVTGIVLMRKGENPSDVLADVKARVETLNQSILPHGREDRSLLRSHVADRNDAAHRVQEPARRRGAGDRRAVLFLGSFRAAAIVAVMIPLSLLATFIGLTIRGIPANLLSLGAMDFGIIVDGAVIVVENIFRQLSQLRGSPDADTRRAHHSRRHGAGRAADVLLDADHHPRPHADLHPAAAGRAHLRAHGVHDHVGAHRIAALLADPGAAALLRAAEEDVRTRRTGWSTPASASTAPCSTRRSPAAAPSSCAPWRCSR